MGNSIAPALPMRDTFTSAPSECPECGHDDSLTDPEFAKLRRLFERQPKPHTCAHVTVEQDALADTLDRCTCRNGWHISA